MTSRWLLFQRLILLPLLREPIRTVLTIFAVALGVGVVVAIDLAGQAATGSFHSSLEALAGRGGLTIRATGGVDEMLLGKLVRLPYPLEFSPRIEDFASLNGKGEAIPFIGLDWIASGKMQTASGTETVANPVLVSRGLHLATGSRIRLLINDALQEFTVAGVLDSEGDAIVADISMAQRVTGKAGKLDSIEVRLPDRASTEYWQRILEQHLPPSVHIAAEGSRTVSNRKMLDAFRSNLRVLSYIALIVGAFLIYNSISVSVVRRRNEIGVLRALGATRALIGGGFLAEALAIAVIGSIFGLAIGRVMAAGAVRLIGSTVNALYVSSEPGAIQLTFATAAAGIGLGLVVSGLAALAPALEAAQVPPIEAMARGREELVLAQRSQRAVWWAAVLLVLSAALSELPAVGRRPLFAYCAVLLLIAGTALAIPYTVSWFVKVAARTIEKLLGVEAFLALGSLRAGLGRTSVLTAALATAVAMMVSVGIMVGSFRETVAVWMDNQLQADFYLRPAGPSAADRHPTMGADVADRIERMPGVRAVQRIRAYAITYEGLPATLAGSESRSIEFLPGENREAIFARLDTGDYCVVSEPFANKHNVRAGSTIRLPLAGVNRAFQVLGVYYDYSTERGFILLSRKTLLRYLPDRAVSGVAVYLMPDAEGEEVRKEIDVAIGGRGILLSPNARLRRGALEIFDRTFRITYALEAVAIVVAVMGIAGALLAMVLDRRRELALIRFLGGAQTQVRRIVLFEAGLLGLLANGIGLMLGILLSLILIFVINKQSFGWTIQFHWPIGLLLMALTGVYAATILAGLYPAQTAVRMNPIEVIHEE
ncbi:MAG TPA: FtsX-like permease family protein [Bryobacteraceae bacterium]